MVNKGGVSVRVANSRFDPNEDAMYSQTFYQEHQLRQKTYIRVSTGDVFIVVVHISPDFDFKGCSEVQIRCTIDGEETAMWTLLASEIAGLRAQNRMRRINYYDTERYIDNKWVRCLLSFGELGIDDNLNYNKKDAAQKAKTLGNIVVTITRGSARRCATETMEPDECPEDLDSTARAVVEDHHITHVLKPVPGPERQQPIVQWHFTPARGPRGRPEELEISYRSQEALELLGVVFKSEDDVKEEPEDRKDPTIKTERKLVMPKLESEEAVNIGDGASFLRTKKKRAIKQEQVIAAPGTKRKREALTKSTSTSKKVKREAPTKSISTSKKIKREEQSVNPETEQDGPWSGTRSNARAKAKVSDTAAALRAPAVATATKIASGQQGDGDDDDEVQFLFSQPAHRVVGSYVID